MTFAYIHEFQTCFSQSSCLPSFPSFLYLSFISYLIGFNLLFKESTLSFLIYIYIYISLLGSNPPFQFLYISLTWYLYYTPFFFNTVEISPFLLIQVFRRLAMEFLVSREFQFEHSENSNPWKNRIAVKERMHARFSWRFQTNVQSWNFLEILYYIN